jgi:hypothetical protein
MKRYFEINESNWEFHSWDSLLGTRIFSILASKRKQLNQKLNRPLTVFPKDERKEGEEFLLTLANVQSLNEVYPFDRLSVFWGNDYEKIDYWLKQACQEGFISSLEQDKLLTAIEEHFNFGF